MPKLPKPYRAVQDAYMQENYPERPPFSDETVAWAKAVVERHFGDVPDTLATPPEFFNISDPCLSVEETDDRNPL